MTASSRVRRRVAAAPRNVHAPSAPPRDARSSIWWLLGLLAITIATYAGMWRHDFVSFDDPDYITENPMVSAGLTWRGVAWAFTTGHAANWHPLTWLSHMLDVQLFGLRAGGHHVVSLALHAANTLLLFAFLHRTTGAAARSAFVAALFAVHPAHVESVAWASERKDVLSTMFWMLTLWAYAAYVRRPSMARYLAALGLFAAGLMSKPMLVTLPFVLLLLDLWPLDRLRRPQREKTVARIGWRHLVWEKLPFLALSIASSITTFLVQRHAGAVSGLETLPFGVRVQNALVAYATYIGEMIWPTKLSAIYPYVWNKPGWWVAGAMLILVAVSGLVLREARSRPYLAVGWLWFLGTLVPTIGLVQVGVQSTADRYTYVPFIGLFIIVAWGIPDLFRRWKWQRVALPVAATASLIACVGAAHAQVGNWKDSAALWQHAVAVSPNNAHALSPLADVLKEQGKVDEAIPLYERALAVEPTFAEAHNKLGVALADRGRLAEAIAQYTQAVRLKPWLAEAHNNLGNGLAKQGDVDGATREYFAAIRAKPDYADPHNGLGALLSDQHKLDDAIAHYKEALRLDPQNAEALNNLGTAFSEQGRFDAAIEQLLKAIHAKPDQADFHRNVAILLDHAGRTAEAAQHFEEVLRLRPDDQSARQALAELNRRMSRP